MEKAMKKGLFALIALSIKILFPIDTNEQYHIYLWARYNQAQENHTVTQTCYNLLIKNNPSPYIYPSFIEYLFDLGQHTIIVQLASALQPIVSFDLQTRLMLAQSLHYVGLHEQAGFYLDTLAKEHPSNPEVMYATAQFKLLTNNPLEALRLIDIHLNHASSREHTTIFHFMKAQIFVLQKKYSAAKTILETTLTAHPVFDKAWLLLGLVNELEGNTPKAIQSYQQYLKLTGSNQMVEEQLARLQKVDSK